MPTTFDPDAYLAQAPEQKPAAPSAFDPDAYLGGETIPQRKGVTIPLTQYAGLFNRAVAPYATAQAVAPVIGPLALGATDITTGIGNAISRAFGGPQLMSGSEAIRSLYPQAVFREPETGAQAIGVNALEAALGARGTANALSRITQSMGPGTARRIVQGMADQPGAQSAAAASGAATQQAAYEYGEPGSNIQSPFVMPLLGVLGGLVGGTAALRGPGAIREMVGRGTPSTAQTHAAASRLYTRMDESGVVFQPTAVNQFLDDLRARLVEAGYKENQSAITAQLNKLNRLRDNPQSFSQLDTVRSQVSKDLIKSTDENTRRLGQEIADAIDDFAENSPESAFTGGAQNRAQAIADRTEARRLWGAVRKSQQMEELIRQARLEDQPLDEALRDKFRSLEQNQRKFNRFTPEEQQFIHNVVQGGTIAKGLTDFSEAMKLRQSLGGTVYAGIGGLATPIANQFGAGVDPYTALALAMGIAGGRKVIGGGANLLAAQRANQAAAAMRGLRKQPLSPLFMPSIQNVARQPIDFAAQSQALNALAQ